MAILTKKLNITIGGKTYDPQYIYSNICISQELMKPNELRFHMTKNTLIEEESDLQVNIANSLLGKEISFKLTTHRDDEGKSGEEDVLMFSGIVFDVDALRERMGTNLVLEVIAYSHDYLLQNSAHCNSYENSDLSAIVSDVASGIPLANSPAMGSAIPYVVQYNETDYQFLSRLAQRYGEWFYNNGSKLVFGQLEQLEKVDLVPGFDILSYRYRMNMSHTKITHGVHNYLDYQDPQASSSSGGGMHRLTDFAISASDSVFQKNTFRNYRSGVAEENGLDEPGHSTMVESKGKQGGMMTCRGRSNRCDLQIGSQIRIKEYYDPGTGEEQEYNHEYLVICGITHYAGNNGSYENEFVAMASSVEHPPYTYSDRYPQCEPQRAVVKDNKDPEKLGRVRVQFLWQQDMTPWIRIAQPHGGGNKGFYFIPEMEEEVMVGFENGNAEKPYVIGTLYHGQAKPPETWYNDEDNIKAIRTRSGHTIEFHDTEGEEFIKIYDNEKDNFILTFSTFEKLIKLESANNIELYAKNDIIMHAGHDINMKADNDIFSEAIKNIYEKAGENNQIDVGKDRTITVVNNISEKAGDDNLIDIGKNRTITVGNNISETAGNDISETAGDNNIIDIGKNRTITVGNNISETAGDNNTIDIGKNRTITVGENISESAGNNISDTAGSNISLDAKNNISEVAGDNIRIDAGSNIDESAGKDISIDAGNDLRESVGKDRTVSVSNNDILNVGEGLDVVTGKSIDISASNKYTIVASDILQDANGKIQMYAGSTWEQKSNSSMKIDGGRKIDIVGDLIKLS